MNRCEACGAILEDRPESCPHCDGYRTVIPLVLEQQAPPAELAVHAEDLPEDAARPTPTGFEAWDEALGGGLVKGSSVILYGEPGARKSTWAGAIANAIAARRRRGIALFLCSEMPAVMVRDAVKRICPPTRLQIVGTERDASELALWLGEVARLKPEAVVYDSLQTVDAGGAWAGSERAVTAVVKGARRAAALMGHVAIIISQVNKSGQPAGPHKSIYACDVVASVSVAKISVKKNRFSPSRDAVLPA